MCPPSFFGTVPIQLPLSQGISSRSLAGSSRSSVPVAFAVFFQYDFDGNHTNDDADRFCGNGSVRTGYSHCH